MPTQQQIAEHLDLNQSEVSRHMERLEIDWKAASLDEIRVRYLRHLRSVAAGHKSSDGLDLTRERVLTERVDRELKQLMVAEKRGMLVNVDQIEPELMNMVGAFRAELLARDDKLKSELDALYGIDLDLSLLNEHTLSALSQLARYEPGGSGVGSPAGSNSATSGTPDDDGMGEAVSGNVGEGIRAAGEIQS